MRLSKIRKQFKNPPKIQNVPYKIKGQYIGFSAYNENKIYLKDDLKGREKATTLAHELGHYKLRRLHIKQFPKRVVQQAKKTNMYKVLKEEGYRTAKIPEEMFAEIYGEYESGTLPKKRFIRFKKKYPTLANTFVRLIKKRV
ncbi:hypothetical protein M0R04_09120 [Candidatus Dojkabacteria bacterium]|jgi:Zn-dependent peptidase ImmA (M78 family)|nr:hypothetical protein [Candidatus Dojkabacteria bacterium]